MRPTRRLVATPAVLQPRWRAVVGVAAAGLVVGCLLLVLQFVRLLGVCALVLSGELLGRFLSSMRALAPAGLAAALVIAVRTTTTAGQQTEVPHLTSPVDGVS